MISKNSELWAKVKSEWTLWWFLISLTVFLPTAYFTPLGIPALLFLTGIPLLYHLRDIKAFPWVAGATAAVVLFAFLRSEFVGFVLHGMGIGQAYVTAPHYYVALIFILIMGWAVVLAARSLDDLRATTVMRWFLLLMLVFTGLLILEALTRTGLHHWMNVNIFRSTRPDLALVKVSNSNCALLMMFWPLAIYCMARERPQFIAAMVVAIAAAAWVTDTNAQLIALAASAMVFYAARYWPRGWSLRGLTPERVAAVGAGAFMLLFPALIYGLMTTGLAVRIKDDLLPSWSQRIDIWTFAVARSLEKPWWGWGYESSRNFMPIIPDHPHNMSLQAWLELGVVGLILVSAFWALLFWRMGTNDDSIAVAPQDKTEMRGLDDAPAAAREMTFAQMVRPYLMAQAVAYFLINSVSYGLWRSWYFCVGIFAAAVMMMAVKAARQEMKLRIKL